MLIDEVVSLGAVVETPRIKTVVGTIEPMLDPGE